MNQHYSLKINRKFFSKIDKETEVRYPVLCFRTTSKDVLMMFFESRKRSGGGDVEDMHLNDDESIAYITFRSDEGKCKVWYNE